MVELVHTSNYRDRGLSTTHQALTLPRHNWYSIREGFSPVLVREAIRSMGLAPASMVIDPFCGSGTTLLAGLEEDTLVAGVEVNPFLAFAARTKLANLAPADFRSSIDAVSRPWQPVRSPLEGYSTFFEEGRTRTLFNRGVLRAFQRLWVNASTVAEPARSLIRLAAIGAAMDCCNARRDGKCLRYLPTRIDRRFAGSDLRRAFDDRVRVMLEDLTSTPLPGAQARSYVLRADARNSLTQLPAFDLCITSPPYLNSFDYSDMFRPELFLGGFVRDTSALRGLRLQTVRSHVQVDWPPPKGTIQLDLLTSTLRTLGERTESLWNKRIPKMILAYFEDLFELLEGLRARAKDHAEVWLVVSTSAYAGVEVPVDLILADLGTKAHWWVRDVHVLRHMRSAGQHHHRVQAPARPVLRESLVIFRNRGLA